MKGKWVVIVTERDISHLDKEPHDPFVELYMNMYVVGPFETAELAEEYFHERCNGVPICIRKVQGE